MKKIIIAVVLIGASAAYIFWQSNNASVPAVSDSTTSAPHESVNPSPAPTESPAPSPAPNPTPISGTGLKDGTYTGDPADAFYGIIQVKATIKGGKLTNVTFVQVPNDRETTREITATATPKLAQEAIAAQSAKVDIVSGATQTSEGFIQTLGSALAKAQG